MIYELNLDDKIEVSKIKKFLADNSDSDYMQSIEWNIIRNEKTKYFIYYVENEEIIWSCNLLEKEKNNVKYLYAPRGPVLKNSNFDLINLIAFVLSSIFLISSLFKCLFKARVIN